MERDFDKKNKYKSLVEGYLKEHGEYISDRKLAKMILKENANINLSDNTLRHIVSKYRGQSSIGVTEACEEQGVSPNDVPYLWLKSKDASLHVKNPLYKQKEYNQFKEDILESLKEHSPIYPTVKRQIPTEPHLLVVDPADIHIGKLCDAFETGEDYNAQIAVKRVKDGVQGILDKSAGFNVDKILFVIGNDVVHVDGPSNTTTSGTRQDTSQMWYKNFLDAKKLYVEVIQMLVAVADVHVVYNPSNHDYANGFFISDVIMTHFRNCENITFDCSISHRKYFLYGNSLIGTTHGDGAKQQDLGSLMSVEAKDMWVYSEHRYCYIHHFHHKISKDYINITVEALRSPSGTDSWHHRNGYTGTPKAIEGFVHHKEHGQIARFTHIF